MHHRQAHRPGAPVGDAGQPRHRYSEPLANHVAEGVSVFFQSENGLIGTGPIPEEGMADRTLTDAAGTR